MISTPPSFLESGFAEDKIGFRIAVSRVHRSMDWVSSGSPVKSGVVKSDSLGSDDEKRREAEDYLRLMGTDANKDNKMGKTKGKKEYAFFFFFFFL